MTYDKLQVDIKNHSYAQKNTTGQNFEHWSKMVIFIFSIYSPSSVKNCETSIYMEDLLHELLQYPRQKEYGKDSEVLKVDIEKWGHIKRISTQFTTLGI